MTLEEFEKIKCTCGDEFSSGCGFCSLAQANSKMVPKLIALARAAKAKVDYNDNPHHDMLARAVKEVFGG